MTFFLLVRMFYHWGATLDIIALAAMVAPNEHFNFIYVVPNRGGVLLGILVGGVPPGSPSPDPISDQKM